MTFPDSFVATVVHVAFGSDGNCTTKSLSTIFVLYNDVCFTESHFVLLVALLAACVLLPLDLFFVCRNGHTKDGRGSCGALAPCSHFALYA